jgi:HAD superfamily hydrolase (TIGR01490 family)
MTEKKFAVFDIDGTLFRSGLYREVVYELLAAGHAPESLLEEVSELEAAWKARRHDNAFNEYDGVVAKSFDAVLPQIRWADFDAAAARVVERLGDYVYTYTRDLAASLKVRGYTLIAISGSQEELVKPFAQRYGFDIYVGQQYERGDTYFTGNIVKTHDGKDVILKKIVEEHGLSFKSSIAVGDTTGDVGMLSIVETPIVFSPDKQLFNIARERHWRVVVERKNMVYELNPYEQSFVLA